MPTGIIIAFIVMGAVIMLMFWIVCFKFHEDEDEKKLNKQHENDMKEAKQKNETKEKMETGNNNNDFFNSVDIMHDLTKRK